MLAANAMQMQCEYRRGDLVSPSRLKSVQIDLCQSKSAQFGPGWPKSTSVSQIDLSQPKSAQVGPNRPKSVYKSAQVGLNRPKST